ncbi:hypothetical protein GW17_00001737 [Ensete ventricosum]|nr:hypothetical protein GW17_00001737 [Ensete ventricosum]
MFDGISQVEAEVPPPTPALGKEDSVNVDEPSPAPVDDAVVSSTTSPDDALAVEMEGDAPVGLPSRGMMFIYQRLSEVKLSTPILHTLHPSSEAKVGSTEGPKYAYRTADHATTAVVSTLASLSTLKKDLYVVPESATSGEIIFTLSKGILPCI